MNILSIETSADETAVSIVHTDGDFPHARYTILGNTLYSQIKIHEEYGGIFPSVAKREHARILTPLLKTALEEAQFLRVHDTRVSDIEVHTPTRNQKCPTLSVGHKQEEELRELLYRESDMADAVIDFLSHHEKPPIDMIAVTSGPGLEPTLWVGVNFAKALSLIWDIPVVPVNHMEGHVLVSVFDGERLPELAFPALLISGGHTEFDLMSDWTSYERIGQTRDDAVGEAFDKSARMMGIPYPGGPEIGRLAEGARERELPEFLTLPRPMLDSGDLDSSFSGLKTAVRYGIEGKELSETDKQALARDLEDAIVDVLIKKTMKAIEQSGAQSLIIGGGVSASTRIREVFKEHFAREYPELALYIPERAHSTDNAIMIALAGHARIDTALTPEDARNDIRADGNRALSES